MVVSKATLDIPVAVALGNVSYSHEHGRLVFSLDLSIPFPGGHWPATSYNLLAIDMSILVICEKIIDFEPEQNYSLLFKCMSSL